MKYICAIFFLVLTISEPLFSMSPIIYPHDSLSPEFSLRFKVSDRENSIPIQGVNVKVENLLTKTIEYFETDKNGEFLKRLSGYKLHDRLNLAVTLEKKGYLTKHTGYDKRPQQPAEVLVEFGMKKDDFKETLSVNPSNSNKSEPNTSSKNQQILIVGSYKKKHYADWTINDLKKKGYKVYSKNMGDYIRVGAYIYANDKSELEAEKNRLKKTYPMDIWVLTEPQ